MKRYGLNGRGGGISRERTPITIRSRGHSFRSGGEGGGGRLTAKGGTECDRVLFTINEEAISGKKEA